MKVKGEEVEYKTADIMKTIEEVAKTWHIPDDVLEQLFPGRKDRYVVFKAGAMYKHKAVGCGEPYVLVYAGSWVLVNTVSWRAWRTPELDAPKAFGNVNDWEFVGMGKDNMPILEQITPSDDEIRRYVNSGAGSTSGELREWLIREIRRRAETR